MDQVFEIMSTDEDMGPRLRDAETPQRFEFPDVDLVVNIAHAPEVNDGQYLRWEWSDDVDWKPGVGSRPRATSRRRSRSSRSPSRSSPATASSSRSATRTSRSRPAKRGSDL